MPEQVLVTGDPRPEKDTLVISQTEGGYRVYSVHQPSRSFTVRADNGHWTCTCYDYASRKNDPSWRCRHIVAVAPASDSEAACEAASAHGGPPVPVGAAGSEEPAIPAQMLIKRSVSPDGRIDSVSVEFSLSVSGDSQSVITEKAVRTLRLQREIVGQFLAMNGKAGERSAASALVPTPNGHANGNGAVDHDGAVVARIVDISEIQGRWGPRLCLNFQVNGNRCALFGSAKQIAEHLASAGCRYHQEDLHPGLRLNQPCRVITKPSKDGRYTNVEEVLPMNGHQSGRAS